MTGCNSLHSNFIGSGNQSPFQPSDGEKAEDIGKDKDIDYIEYEPEIESIQTKCSHDIDRVG